MFQCIIQQRTGWTHPEVRDVFSDVRQQLNEQLRCLDLRLETQVAIVQELQDYFRRRAEVELEYSKSLDKLGKSIQQRHKEQKQKREQWPLYSSFSCWQQLVTQTKNLSKDHGVLSEIYATHLVARLQSVIEDCTRIYRKCREIAFETHEEILRILQELHTTMKTYQSYQTESKAAEAKLRTAELQRMKLQQSIPKEKLERSKKYKIFEKEVVKRKNKYTDAKLKALKAKNEYQLCLEASNNTIHKYFVDDLSDLIDCMDLGFHAVVSKALLMHVTSDQGRGRALCSSGETLSHTIHAMDSLSDKQKFLEQHHGAFMIPKRFEFQNGGNTTPAVQSVQTSADEELAIFHSIEPELQKGLHLEMEARLRQLEERVANLRTESDEVWKTLETAEINLLEFLNSKDFDCTTNFGNGGGISEQCEITLTKQKANKQEIEDFYVTKIREFILGTSRISRLDAKADFLRDQLSKDNAETSLVLAKLKPTKRKRIGRRNMTGQPKLFGGSLEEYIEATRDEIPLIVKSCVRVINLFGLHHQGIFRVSGSQIEITNFREAFEKGEDPLADTTDASDINSVAGVLKLYLRELREPLFPIIYFDHFVSLAQLESKHELINGIRKFLLTLPRSVLIVIRYLFAFLNHLSEYSDENMMDAYNLAICFGPTLMPAPDDKDQVQYQNQVNDLIKNMILHHDELFPADLAGLQYEKYINREPYLDIDVGDSPSNDNIIEDPDSEIYPSEDEADSLVATAQYDFNARSNRELSIKKGDAILLRKQVSTDWWMGSVNGKEGLVPDKYISLRIKGEDRDNIRSSSSEESVRKESTASASSSTGGVIRLDSVSEGSSSVSSCAGAKTPKAVNKERTTTITTAIISSSSTTSASSGGHSVPGGGAYGYHHSHDDEESAFEKSMDSLENMNPLQFETQPIGGKRAEPIYAEPTKCPRVMTPVMLRAKTANRGGTVLGSDDEEVLATALETSTPNRHTMATTTAKNNARPFNSNGPEATSTSSSSSIQSRRYHSKSLSLSEGKTLAKAFETPALRLCTFSGSSQLFQQNRNMWEKRADQESGSNNSNGGSGGENGDRNSRNAAPDLVLDLPATSTTPGVEKNGVTSSDAPESLTVSVERDNHHDQPQQPNSPEAEETNGTGADCFAHNQFTLKKNEKFTLLEAARHKPSTDNNNRDPEKAIQEEKRGPSVLHISEEEEKEKQTNNSLPIAEKNTHKFVTQFADLKLTGGSLPIGGGISSSAAAASATGSVSNEGGGSELAFKMNLRREKPQILRKPVLAPPSTGTASGPSSLMSFSSVKGKGESADAATGAKSLE